MEQTIPQRYAGLIGLGLMYLWGTTLLVWGDWIQSDVLLVKCIGIMGALLASLSGLAIFLYVSDLETQLRSIKEKNALNETQAQEWKDQSQLAISLLEKERAKNC